jgi:ankyrin repeat domain-containing protein 17
MEEWSKPSPLDLDGAIIDGNLTKVRHLLDAGVDPNAFTSMGDSMIRSALVFGHGEIAALLRERGAQYGLMEAALAGDTSTLRALLDGGEDINLSDRKGRNALSLAVSKGHAEAVRLLLERGADPNAAGTMGHTPLSIACTGDFPEIAYLLAGAGATVGIVEAAHLGDLPLLKRLLDEGADIETHDAAGVTPLMAASACGHVECVRFLLEHGANAFAENSRGQQAITWAITRERVPVIRVLLDHGVNVDSSNPKSGWTLLESAVSFGKVRSVEALLARGADPDLAGGNGRTPLQQCAYFASLHTFSKSKTMSRIAALLLDAGAQIEARDNLQYTPLIAAASDGDADMVRLLLERGADVRASTPGGHADPLSCVRCFDVNGEEKTEARTLIMEAYGPDYAVYDAAERGDLERLTALLESGAPADEGIVFDTRLLKSEHFSAEDLAETPLAAAAGKGHLAVVNLLLARMDVSAKSRNSALFAAESEKQVCVARILREAGAVNELADRVVRERAGG